MPIPSLKGKCNVVSPSRSHESGTDGRWGCRHVGRQATLNMGSRLTTMQQQRRHSFGDNPHELKMVREWTQGVNNFLQFILL